jgi:hypothetical protein
MDCFRAILRNNNVEATTTQNIIGWTPLHARGMTALQVLEHQQYETDVPQWERGMTLSQFELVLEQHQQDEKYDPQSQWEPSIVNR